MKTAIIIPARMASQRFPDKPMAKINGIPMIERVWRQGINSKVGDVFVACSEVEVFNLIISKGGKAIMTDPNLPSGTDRVFAAFNLLENKDDYESIINLQGDMPLIDYKNIQSANIPLHNGYNIGTIATDISSDEIKNENITKVSVDWQKEHIFGNSLDFYKSVKTNLTNIYQHVGIYSFKPSALKKFISFDQSKNEIENRLEQLRALDNNIKINVALANKSPIGVDTKEDYIAIQKIMKYK